MLTTPQTSHQCKLEVKVKGYLKSLEPEVNNSSLKSNFSLKKKCRNFTAAKKKKKIMILESDKEQSIDFQGRIAQ
jgi:hypothetical protein